MAVYFRRNLPHLYAKYGLYFITFRLANSLPQNKIIELQHEAKNPAKQDKRTFVKYDELLDADNSGAKYLSVKEIAEICSSTLHYYDKKEINLICYTLMPNHVHFVFELLQNKISLSKILQLIKGVSSRKCNIYLNRTGKFWQDESFDRLIRDEKELYMIIRYILLNPVKSGLVKTWSDWEYSYCRKEYMVSDEDLVIKY